MSARLWFLTITLCLLGGEAFAACSSPSGVAGSLDYDPTSKIRTICDGTTWKNLEEIDYSGTGARQLMQIGTDAGACTAAKTGRLRYNSGGIDLCNGTSWTAIQPPTACGDMTPNAFTFTDEANASLSTLTTSNIVQISGISCVVAVTLTGSAGSPQYRICSDSGCSTVVTDWTTSTMTISSGQYVQMRLTSAGTIGTERLATLAAGLAYDQWAVRTPADCSGAAPIGTVCTDGTIYAGMSPDGNVKMYVTRCDAGKTIDTGGCTAGDQLYFRWNNGVTNTVSGVTSTTDGNGNTAALAALYDDGYPYHAAQYCHDLEQHGHTDWYLPASGEWEVIHNQTNAIGINPYNYWASTEHSITRAKSRGQFGIGENDKQNGSQAVRCARQ